jgi:CubicO group peptidase (beta-lactamase class C family)
MAAMNEPAIESLVPDLSGQLQNILKKQRLPGLAVGIVRDQELAFFAGLGRIDLRSHRAPDSQTLFRVASITKTLTAAAILQLRDRGLLSLDDPLAKHIPEFAHARPRAGALEQVTLRRLLTHRSGLPTEAPLPCWDALEFPTQDELLAAMPQLEVAIPPDSAFKYSNLAFGLLGEVVARASGDSYAEYLHAQILDPLGMTGGLELDERQELRRAIGYYPRPFDDDFDAAPCIALQGLAPCGQLHASVADLARWIALQFRTGDVPRGGSQILAGPTIEESHRPQYIEPDWSVGYCLGWRATRQGDRVYHGHGGGIHGFASYILFCKPYRLGVICLANVWPHPGLLGPAVEIAESLIRAGWNPPAEASNESPARTPSRFERLLGTYEATAGIFVNVAYRAGELRLEKTPLNDYLLHAPAILESTADSTAFVVRGGRGAGELARFHSAADGSVAHFSLGGFVYRRMVPVR